MKMLFKVTEAAARQVRRSAEQGGTEGLPLRVAASKNADGSIDYKMGFDEFRTGDLHVPCGSINVVVTPACGELLDGTTMDHVEIEPGQFRFIFMNPNDANYAPPAEEGAATP